mmetsp:Transcript_32013/g.74813  ORF Transcript_32013/g.74813 Transcript_32013/m.74813 type:complete len:85 (+) Transcript_32013:844-1098(+)
MGFLESNVVSNDVILFQEESDLFRMPTLSFAKTIRSHQILLVLGVAGRRRMESFLIEAPAENYCNERPIERSKHLESPVHAKYA